MRTLKSSLVPVSLAGAAVTIVAAAATGCIGKGLNLGSNDASLPTLFVRNVLAPVTPSDAGVCDFTASAQAAALSTGTADVAFQDLSDYTPVFLVGNQLVTGEPGATAASRIVIQGAVTTITDLAGDTSLETMFASMCEDGAGDQAACEVGRALAAGDLTAPTNPISTVETATLEPPDGSDPSYATIGVTIIDGQTVDVLRDYFERAQGYTGTRVFNTAIQLLTRTQVEGMTTAGAPVSSNVFEFAVTFTYGQLVSNLVIQGNDVCVQPEPSGGAATCVPGQDVKSPILSLPTVPACGTAAADAGLEEVGDGGID